MRCKHENELKEIDRKMILVSIIDLPGSVLVGLGLYGKFAAKGNSFLPILDNDQVVNVMLTTGGLIMVWGGFQIVRKAELKNSHGL